MANYYGFIQYDRNSGYKITIEYGILEDTPYDYSEVITTKIVQTLKEVDAIIQGDTLGTKYYLNGRRVN